VGGQASLLYGVPRSTNDVDILVRRSEENGQRLVRALSQVGFGIAKELTTAELLRRPIFSFIDQIKVDVFTDLPGVGGYDDAVRCAVTHDYRGIRIPTLSLEHLIASKERIGRPQDQADVLALREIQRRRA